MYAVELDCKTGGLKLLEKKALIHHEIRPVFVPELVSLGLDKYFDFETTTDNLIMWRDLGWYYYRGQKAFHIRADNPGVPQEFCLPRGTQLDPVDMRGTLNRNYDLLTKLRKDTIDWLRKTYDERKKKNEFWYVAYSGGKDSQVLLDLAIEALGDSISVIFDDTTMEFPQTYKTVEGAKKFCEMRGVSFHVARAPYCAEESWSKFGPPGRINRWCCDVHKSSPSTILARKLSDGRPVVDIQGVRKAESFTRSQYEAVVPSKVLGATDVRPILEWGSYEIWLTIFQRGLYINDIYRLGAGRVGCVLCPMSSKESDIFAEKHAPDLFRELIRNVELDRMNRDSWRRRMDANFDRRVPRLLDEEKIDDEDGYTYVTRFSVYQPKTFDAWLKTLPKNLAVRVKNGFEATGKKDDDFAFKCAVHFNRDRKGRAERERFVKFIRRAVYCVGCGVCEANCVHGALKCIDGGVQVDETKCRQCGKCMTGRAAQCLRYKSQRVAKNRDEIIARANANMERRKHEEEQRRESYPLLQLQNLSSVSQ